MAHMQTMTVRSCPFLALIWLASIGGANAAEWYIAPEGSAKGLGTQDSPWDLETAVGAGQKVAAGDTLWLLGGTYKYPNRKPNSSGFAVRLVGRADAPIQIRGVKGQRVTIDGGLAITKPSTYICVRDLEILVSENLTHSRRLEEPGSHPASFNRPHGGLGIHAGTGCKYINLVIHHNSQGVGFWSGATDSELYGCVIYDNGWEAPDRGHGHAVYTQNATGTKTISDCIMTGGYGYTLHAYGSERAFVDNFLVEGNICYDAGQFLIGGGRPSHGIRVVENYLHNVSMRLGYSAPHNEDCELRNNVIVNGSLAINDFQKVINKGNLVLRPTDPRPRERSSRVFIRPYRYDPDRCHVAVFNWAQGSTVSLEPGPWLKNGDAYRLMNPRDMFGSAVMEGVYDGRPIRVPVKGEFAAFVLLRQSREAKPES